MTTAKKRSIEDYATQNVEKQARVGSHVNIQRNRTLNHPFLQQQVECPPCNEPFTFVVGADTQLGILTVSKNWDVETAYSEKAVSYINAMSPKPAFVSMCGDLVDMEPAMFEGRFGTKEECVEMQDIQWEDFKKIWSGLDPEIPLVCLCGNHDVGNRPTVESIQRFTNKFGDDYLAFWCRGCYMICLNSNMYFDCADTEEMHQLQRDFLEERLKFARAQGARRIFLFTHHPWFLHHEEEDEGELAGKNFIPGTTKDDDGDFIGDSYFPVKRAERRRVMQLCREFRVDGCFAGHYHQNLVTETSWGMPMIVTGALCGWSIESTDKDLTNPENLTPAPGVRVVHVTDTAEKGFSHHYEIV